MYSKVAVGGTFYLLHRGHKTLLKRAFEVGEEVIIGIMKDASAEKLDKDHPISPCTERINELRSFLFEEGLLERTRIVVLTDPFGPTITDETIKAIVVSEETRPRVKEINKIRKRRGFKPLDFIVIDMVICEDGEPLSTTRILRGEVDREGLLIDKAESSR